mmetsp:Transcript_12495/g.36304  ORF Transcript_12495/g.36304 Transcript_12495/m.36304 type:complete len:99 (+) Transcript_12495:167-463(+)
MVPADCTFATAAIAAAPAASCQSEADTTPRPEPIVAPPEMPRVSWFLQVSMTTTYRNNNNKHQQSKSTNSIQASLRHLSLSSSLRSPAIFFRTAAPAS